MNSKIIVDSCTDTKRIYQKLQLNSPSYRLTRTYARKNGKKIKGVETELPREKNAIKQIKHVNTKIVTKRSNDCLSVDEKQNHSGKVHDLLAKVLLLNCFQEGTQDDFEEKILSLKLQSMKKYLKPLSILTEKTLEEISKNANRNLLHAMEKLNTYKSIIDGIPFSTPENMSKKIFLQQMEDTLVKLTATLKSKYPEEFIDEPISYNNMHHLYICEDQNIGLEIVVKRLNIVDYLPLFSSNGIFNCEDLKLLTEEDMKELGVPVGVRNRIKKNGGILIYNLFEQSPIRINTKNEKNEELTIGEYQKIVCNQLWESFICPITHDLMVDPVMAADGHTYDREAICKWFISNNTSPLTGAPLSHTSLIPNHNLRSQIRQFYPSISLEN